ncbi:hypothetical protein GCM10022232_84560 [Streptomyces plumbiresistens]|uniref:Uncharacterized protein n=1 Tax=Streptomyces plumbiresistens TaxID=511811 RepID=A0ABP7TGR5_9ACTN
MLAVAHAPGHAVHGDTHRLACHVIPFVGVVRVSYAVVRAAYASTDERYSKRFLSDEKLASEQRSRQDRDGVELFEGANNWGWGL